MKLTNFMLMIDDHYCATLSLSNKIKHTREASEDFKIESNYRWAISKFKDYVLSELSVDGRVPIEVPTLKLYELAVTFEYKMQVYASEGIPGSQLFWNALVIMEDISDLLSALI